MARTGRPPGKKNSVGHSAGRPSIQKKDDPRQTTLFQTMKKINQNGESSSQADEAVVEESSMQENEIDISDIREEQLPVVEDQNILITLDEEEELNNRILPEIDDGDADESVTDEQEFLSGEVQNGVLYHYFEEVQKRLTEEAMPAEYNNGTFWIRPMQPFFALLKKKPVEYLYRPDIFLWIPHLLLNNQINDLHCPTCNSSIETKGFNKKPHARRIVDLDRCFYILTKRYRCLSSICGSTFNGYDSKIMRQLPVQLQAEFPAYLSHRGAVSKQVGDLLRPCIQNSMGPERISKVLRELHTLKHDRSELQYLTVMKAKYGNQSITRFFTMPTVIEPFSPFDNQKGYAGYTPTQTYIRTIYTAIISKLRPYMDKQMMLLGGKVLKGDHSFKIIKHMASIDGTNMFNALYTICNEFEEIRMMLLVPSKSLEHLKWSFQKMMQAYEGYGHDSPVIFYTDNVRGDRKFLENVIPSLKVGVRSRGSREDDGNTEDSETLELPESIQIQYLRGYDEIENEMKILLVEKFHFVETNGVLESCSTSVVTGFDCEWPYNITTNVKGKLSVVQIAYASSVLVLHLDPTWNVLPSSLIHFLKSPVILKIGRQVGGDFKQVKDSFGIDCEGAFELGRFCKLKKVVKSGRLSLSAICKEVIGRGLSKDLRISDWSYSHELSSSQIHYAALDAWASLEIYNVINNICEELISTPTVGQYLSLWSPMGVAGYGIVEASSGFSSNGIVQVSIIHIVRTSFVLPSIDGHQTEIILESIKNDLPKTVSVHKSLLRNDNKRHVELEIVKTTTPSNVSNNGDMDITGDGHEAEHEENNVRVSALDFARTLFGDDIEDIDKANFEYGYGQFKNRLTASITESTETRLYTRVVKDVFHLMDSIKIGSKHSLKLEFVKNFRNCLFILDADDQENVSAVLSNKGTSYEEKMAKNSAWIWKRVKRTIPPPHILYTGLYNLFLSFGSLKCVKSGLPLFDKVAWKSAVNVLVAVKDGHVSDPPDLSLYHVRGKDRDGLTLYRCVRGTNSLEGGVHQNIIRKFGSFGAGPELTDCALTEYRLRHNTDAGTLNRLGYEHKGHYDPWLNQVIEKLRASLHLSATQQTACMPNALDFCGSDEVFGICPISNDLMETLCVEKINTLAPGTSDLINTGDTCLSDVALLLLPSTKRANNSRFEYIACKQHTKYAILPVHTSEEKALFEDILVDNCQSSAEPNWSQFASRWNSSADGVAIFYKTPEHLKLYYNICQENKIVDKAKAKHSTIIQKVRSVISETMIPQSVPPAINLPGRSNNTTVPFNRIPVSNQQIQSNVLSPMYISRIQQERIPLQVAYNVPYQTASNPFKRKRIRTCQICGDTETCPGRNNRNKCRSPSS